MPNTKTDLTYPSLINFKTVSPLFFSLNKLISGGGPFFWLSISLAKILWSIWPSVLPINRTRLSTFFNPVYFDAEEWVLMAKNAGMKYITITSRHHDGFSMFDSKASDYNIVDRTPYGKDVLKMLAEACRKHDIKLFFYYSQLDWYRDDYFPRGRTGTGIEGRGEGNWNDYIDFMKAQLNELLTNYGEIGGIWFDGEWDQIKWDGKRFGTKIMDFK